MKVLLFRNMYSSADYHRIETPFRFLEMNDGDRFQDVLAGTILYKEIFKDANVMVINRHSAFDDTEILALRKKYNIKLWVDLDDHWDLYPDHYLYKQWVANNTANKIKMYLKNADVVTVTTPKLAIFTSQFNKRVEVVPNAIPFGFEQFSPNKIEASRLRFIYVGGASHVGDLKEIEGVFNTAEWDPELRAGSSWILTGEPINPERNEVWKKMVSIMRATPKFRTRPMLPLRQYMDHYNHGDISIAPLEDTHFNACKSNLKTIEAGCMAIPIIASNLAPYRGDSAQGLTLCNNNYMWVNAIKYYMKNPTKVIDDGLALHEYCKKNYDLVKVNLIRRQILNSLI